MYITYKHRAPTDITSTRGTSFRTVLWPRYFVCQINCFFCPLKQTDRHYIILLRYRKFCNYLYIFFKQVYDDETFAIDRLIFDIVMKASMVFGDISINKSIQSNLDMKVELVFCASYCFRRL